jgi:hypothetical protein
VSDVQHGYRREQEGVADRDQQVAQVGERFVPREDGGELRGARERRPQGGLPLSCGFRFYSFRYDGFRLPFSSYS